jgi:hypothetical protein
MRIYRFFETSLNEFINKTDWNGQTLSKMKNQLFMYIGLFYQTSDQFTATLQVLDTFNSSYSSPVLNYNDKIFSFRYTEFENLIFNRRSSNLISFGNFFYSYMILGMDQDICT